MINKNYSVSCYHLKDDGTFPNSHLPVLLYKSVLTIPYLFPVSYIRRLFRINDWPNAWNDGINEYHHYHSITHEVIGAYKGACRLLLGGSGGLEITFQKGDVVIIPAGMAHKNLSGKKSVKCVGAYPDGNTFDVYFGKPGERPDADDNIRRVSIPTKDPVFGTKEIINKFWR